MIDGVPRKLPPHVCRETTRHNTVVFYFRRGKGPRIRLPAPTDREFDTKYHAALGDNIESGKRVVGINSLEWLVRRYKESTAWAALSPATRKQRDNIFVHVLKKAGDKPYRAINRKSIIAGREARADTPAQARNFLDAMRGLFRWAEEAELVKTDPTAGVKNPRRPKGGDGFAAWTDEDVATFEAKWKLGSKERVWMHVLLYTGLRRGDAVVLGRQHVRNGFASLKTEKTGTEVNFEVRAELAATLAVGPTGDLAFIVGENGEPLTKETFGNYFRAACSAAGVMKSAHGLRKLAATKAAEAGLTVNQMEALFGWTGGTMASHYTKTADRKRLAVEASEKIRNANRPHQVRRVARTSKKQ